MTHDELQAMKDDLRLEIAYHQKHGFPQTVARLGKVLNWFDTEAESVFKNDALIRFIQADNPVTVRMWREMFDAARKEQGHG